MARMQPIGETAPARCLPAVAAAVLLSGCVAGGAAGPIVSRAAPGEYQVSVDGEAFRGTLRPGSAGAELTRHGARPVEGSEIRVTALAGLGPDQGLSAKRGARATCLEAGGRFNGTAIGHHDGGGVWVFPGGCA
ncbi:hypothetical protein [Pseudogemmobacter sonorensis]|uniref:hypothetical protein n=1 Tax=Pseudogemmobacter sonorensis TaxID=2989681 RepID=UPI0036BF9A07